MAKEVEHILFWRRWCGGWENKAANTVNDVGLWGGGCCCGGGSSQHLVYKVKDSFILKKI